MKRTGTLLVALFLGVCFASHCEATVYHSDGSAASVQSIHDNQAQNGDTITLPAGTFTWTTGVTISKGITLQGAGIGQTIVKDNVQSTPLVNWTLRAGVISRLTGIEFQGGGRINSFIGIIQVVGSNTNGSQFRWDHCKWNNLQGISRLDTVIGVIDHVTFDITAGLSNGIWQLYDSNWNGGGNGDLSWSAPVNWGGSDWLFIEDCTFISDDPTFLMYATDAYAGARFVFRHNTLGGFAIANHGTESTGRARGTRAMDIYANVFDGHNLNSFIGGSRSGSVLLHDNFVTNYWPGVAFSLIDDRRFAYFCPWGGADGTNVWDVNAPSAFFTGTAAANSSGTTVTVSGANWTTNQWAGHTARRTSNACNVITQTFSLITSNTANTLTYINGSAWGLAPLSFCAGDGLEIRKVEQALDGIGRGGGSIISGGSCALPPIPPLGWNNQVPSPCYSWNNGGINLRPQIPGIRVNEHYFNDTPMPGYTPYIYPHPLVSGNPTPTATPTPTTRPTATPTATATATSTATVSPTPTPIGTATPHPVGGFVATAISCTETDLSWSYCCLDLANGGFDIERGTDNIHFTQINQVGFWERSYQDTTAPSGLNYYRIRAFNDNGVGDYSFASATQPSCQSPTPTATPTPTPIGTATPHPVGSFVATAVSCTETDLSWSYCCLDLANGGFDIERGTDNIHFTQINQVGFWERSYQDTTAPSGLNYYRIRAFNDNGVGDYSFASATQPSCQSPTPTATPTPCLAIVPDFVGQKLLDAQTIWESAGFTTEVITDGPPGESIIWQSLPPGYQGDCSTTVIFVRSQPGNIY